MARDSDQNIQLERGYMINENVEHNLREIT